MFSASGRVITFHGFLKAYVEGTDEAASAATTTETRLPDAAEGDPVSRRRRSARSGHETKPPARYTEATLIRELEEREIGRPSTYASIIGTILNRGYVYKKGTALVPAWLAFSVIRLLEEHFPRLVSYEFTAGMEDVLDEIAGGRKDRVTELAEFYFGSERVAGAARRWSPSSATSTPASWRRSRSATRAASTCGSAATAPTSRAPTTRATRPASAPTCPTTCRPTSSRSRRPRSCSPTRPARRSSSARTPRPGCAVVAKNGRYGPYVTEVLPEDAPEERQAAHRLAVQVDVAGHDHPRRRAEAAVPAAGGRRRPESGEEITAQNGRYGPYLKKGTDSRSLTSEEQLFTITLDEALAIYAQPKQRGRAAAAPPLKELGNDPVSGSRWW